MRLIALKVVSMHDYAIMITIKNSVDYSHVQLIYFFNRGQEFRKEFSRLGEVRSILPKGVNIMALTATATGANRRSIMETLGMSAQSTIVSVCPSKSNVMYSVAKFSSFDDAFGNVIASLKEDKISGRIIILCRTINDCSDLYLHFKTKLGSKFLCPSDAPDLCEYRLVEVYHSLLEPSHKQRIVSCISNPAFPLKIVIATVAFGMGIDIPDVREQ